jgi:hypothetical protein
MVYMSGLFERARCMCVCVCVYALFVKYIFVVQWNQEFN